MIDIRCSRNGYVCNGCPIKQKCDDADNATAVDLWSIYEQGRVDVLDSILELPRLNHYDMYNELMYQSIKVDDIKRLKEKKE